MIHSTFNKKEIAFRYYSKVAPEKEYDREQARKQFNQDKKINWSVVEKIIIGIYEDQIKVLKKLSK